MRFTKLESPESAAGPSVRLRAATVDRYRIGASVVVWGRANGILRSFPGAVSPDWRVRHGNR